MEDIAALAREMRELNAVLRGQAERDAPVRRSLYESRFLGRERSLTMEEISLTTAHSLTGVGDAGPKEFNFPGAVLFADALSTGNAFIHFDAKDAPGFPFSSSTGLFLPFRKFYITNTAQAGLVLRLWYGFDAGIIPPNQDISNIGTVSAVTAITNALTPHSLKTTPYYRYSTSSALGTIVAPGSNINGVYIAAGNISKSGSSTAMRLMMKTSAPSAWNDATAIVVASLMVDMPALTQPLQLPIIVPPGYGLYEQASGAVNSSGADLSLAVL